MTVLRSLLFITLTAFSVTGLTQDDSNATEKKEAKENPKVLVETNQGNFTIELYASEAPKTVANFLAYVDSGFYDGTIFHRVIKDFVIQGGGFTKELSKKDTNKPVVNEAKKELPNFRGTLSMARTSAINSATSQFFINLKHNESLDYRKWNPGYAVFGKINDSDLYVIDNIARAETGTVGIYRDVPNQAIIVSSMSRVGAAKKATDDTAVQAVSE